MKLCNLLTPKRIETYVESEAKKDAFGKSCPQAGASGIAADATAADGIAFPDRLPAGNKAGPAQGVLLFQGDAAEFDFRAVGRLPTKTGRNFRAGSPSPQPSPPGEGEKGCGLFPR
jgi:hypothetical protein